MYKSDLFEHPILFSLPQRTVPSPFWRQHVPFAMFLVDVLAPKILVELGTHYGDSYCAFCQAVAELHLPTACYAIDTWKGDPHVGQYGPEVLADLTAYHDPRYGSFSTLIQSTFDEALKHFSEGTIDILHIDGYHTYEVVKHDFDSWLPKMSPRGIILLHDINEKRGTYAVWKFWDEIKQSYPHFSFLHCHGLGVLAVGDEPPPDLDFLFKATRQQIASIQTFFFMLGDRLTIKQSSQAERDSMRAERDAMRAELDSIRAERDSIRAERDAIRAERDAIPGERGALRADHSFVQSRSRIDSSGSLRRLSNFLLPAGTKRRALARRVFRAILVPGKKALSSSDR